MASYNPTNRPGKLALDDEIIICDVKHVVCFTKGYYLDASSKFNEYAFQKLGINSKEMARKIYGYEKGGSWPFADSLEDLTKLVNHIFELEEKKIPQNKV